VIKNPLFTNLTKDSYSQTGLSTNRKRSRTPSQASTSRRRRSRNPTPEADPEDLEDPEEKLRQEKVERREFVCQLKALCVLDPTRAMTSYEATLGDVSWLEVRFTKSEVDQLIKWRELENYVFRVPRRSDTVVMYDWVSCAGL
jgi:hypothetical protein